MNEYFDNLGRMDLKPVNGGEASTNNQLLYTGELAILMKLVGGYAPADFFALAEAVGECSLDNFPGLYTRHPEPYRFKTENGKPNFVPVSFDEILGACFTNWCAGEIKDNENILTHAELTNNRFCDIPNYELMDSYLGMFSKGFWKDLKAYYDEAKTYETSSERKFKVGDRFKDWGVNRNNGIGTIVEIDNDILMVRFDEDKYTDKLLTRYNFDSELILLTPLLEALL
jgi:hypothetical protein